MVLNVIYYFISDHYNATLKRELYLISSKRLCDFQDLPAYLYQYLLYFKIFSFYLSFSKITERIEKAGLDFLEENKFMKQITLWMIYCSVHLSFTILFYYSLWNAPCFSKHLQRSFVFKKGKNPTIMVWYTSSRLLLGLNVILFFVYSSIDLEIASNHSSLSVAELLE